MNRFNELYRMISEDIFLKFWKQTKFGCKINIEGKVFLMFVKGLLIVFE